MVISLYFHFPFCTKKCPYFHFYVIPNQKYPSFIPALLKEWELRLPRIEGKEIASLYFGGGTPTLCIEGIQKILERVSAPEITVETNPEDVTPELIKTLKDLGVNRISIGIQSLNNSLLKQLGRNHTAQKGIEATHISKKGGIENISIDLMYELPYQTFEIWNETVEQALLLPITHLSLYNLTIEPHTIFKKREKELTPHLPSEEEATKMLNYASLRFEEEGLHRYEISAFAKNNHLSIHNSGYWTGRSFLGFGPSAFSYWEGKRFQNVCHLSRYIKTLEKGMLPVDFEEKLPFPASLHERIAINLRLIKGMIFTHPLPQETKNLLLQLDQDGWIHYRENQAVLTEKGRLFYDTVAEAIVS